MNRNKKKVLKMEGRLQAKKLIDELVNALPSVDKMDKPTLYFTVLRCYDTVKELKGTHKITNSIINRIISDALGYDSESTVLRILATYNLHLEGKKPENDTDQGSYFRTWEKIFEGVGRFQTWQEFFKVAS